MARNTPSDELSRGELTCLRLFAAFLAVWLVGSFCLREGWYTFYYSTYLELLLRIIGWSLLVVTLISSIFCACRQKQDKMAIPQENNMGIFRGLVIIILFVFFMYTFSSVTLFSWLLYPGIIFIGNSTAYFLNFQYECETFYYLLLAILLAAIFQVGFNTKKRNLSTASLGIFFGYFYSLLFLSLLYFGMIEKELMPQYMIIFSDIKKTVEAGGIWGPLGWFSLAGMLPVAVVCLFLARKNQNSRTGEWFLGLLQAQFIWFFLCTLNRLFVAIEYLHPKINLFPVAMRSLANALLVEIAFVVVAAMLFLLLSRRKIVFQAISVLPVLVLPFNGITILWCFAKYYTTLGFY